MSILKELATGKSDTSSTVDDVACWRLADEGALPQKDYHFTMNHCWLNLNRLTTLTAMVLFVALIGSLLHSSASYTRSKLKHNQEVAAAHLTAQEPSPSSASAAESGRLQRSPIFQLPRGMQSRQAPKLSQPPIGIRQPRSARSPDSDNRGSLSVVSFTEGAAPTSPFQLVSDSNQVRLAQADPIQETVVTTPATDAGLDRIMETLPPSVPSLPDNFQPLPLLNSTPTRAEITVQPAMPTSDDAVLSLGGKVTLAVRDTPLQTVLYLLAQQQGLSVVSPSNLNSTITMTLQPTSLEEAMDALMSVSGCTWNRHGNVIYVTPLQKDVDSNFFTQGRIVRVYDLNYMSSEDAEKVITGLLSPVGKVFSRTIDKTNKRRNYEQVIVEDLPQYVNRITEYVARSDQPPRQVLVETRVLQVRLGKDKRHGVNLEGLINQTGPEVWLRTQSFASPAGPGAVFSVEGSRFNQLLDILNTTTDAKTLAAPKVLMINGQESRIQIGQRLAYVTSTTTQTVTVQGVNFLDVGVLLTVTPHITDNGLIMMKINPKVSSGQINPANDLPEEETTELQSTVLVQDGAGIIIGGLIQETDIERQSKLPFLGDLWVVGRLFQRRSLDRERAEVIIALLPRIVDCTPCLSEREQSELSRAQLPLLTPELMPAPRPEPSLNDATRAPVRSIKGIMQ